MALDHWTRMAPQREARERQFRLRQALEAQLNVLREGFGVPSFGVRLREELTEEAIPGIVARAREILEEEREVDRREDEERRLREGQAG